MDQLALIYGRRSAQTMAREKKVAKLDGQLQQMAAVVGAPPPARQAVALPLDDFAAEIRQLQAALSTPEETKVRQVLSQNAALARNSMPTSLPECRPSMRFG